MLFIIISVGLAGNLKSCSPAMYTLFNALKARASDEPITQEEIDIASGKISLEGAKVKDYIKTLEAKTSNIQKAFQKQMDLEVVRSFQVFN